MSMRGVPGSEGLDLLFREARTRHVWLDRPVDDALLKQVYDLAKMGPTSANMCPMRILFVKSREAKERLRPALDAGNVDKTMKAPVTVRFSLSAGDPLTAVRSEIYLLSGRRRRAAAGR